MTNTSKFCFERKPRKIKTLYQNTLSNVRVYNTSNLLSIYRYRQKNIIIHDKYQ